jgi:hypothetical protein
LLSDPEIMRLVAATTVEADPDFTAEYPRLQGAEVVITLRDGQIRRRSLPDVIPATPVEIRARFKSQSERVLGPKATSAIEGMIDGLENQKDVSTLAAHLSVS